MGLIIRPGTLEKHTRDARESGRVTQYAPITQLKLKTLEGGEGEFPYYRRREWGK